MDSGTPVRRVPSVLSRYGLKEVQTKLPPPAQLGGVKLAHPGSMPSGIVASGSHLSFWPSFADVS